MQILSGSTDEDVRRNVYSFKEKSQLSKSD